MKSINYKFIFNCPNCFYNIDQKENLLKLVDWDIPYSVDSRDYRFSLFCVCEYCNEEYSVVVDIRGKGAGHV